MTLRFAPTAAVKPALDTSSPPGWLATIAPWTKRAIGGMRVALCAGPAVPADCAPDALPQVLPARLSPIRPRRVASAVWQIPPGRTPSRSPSGITVVHPDDADFDTGLARLLRRLARVGIEQYLVPEGLGEQSAQTLKGLPLRQGFILESASLLDASGWALADLPTVLLLQDGAPWADALFRRCRDWTEAHPEQSLDPIMKSYILLVYTPARPRRWKRQNSS